MTSKKHRDTLPPGYQLHWYEFDDVLGRGAYGITYLAKDKNLEQLVAIKEYLPTEFASRVDDDTVHPMTGEHEEIYAWGLDRFLREARTLAKFKHQNIVRVQSVFEENNTAYMVMEYEHGEDLSKAFKKNKVLSEQKLLEIFLPVIDGLAEIHNEGFIHRDIKPSNIYIREDGSPVLLDFGSARQTKAENTRALTSLVTYGYAPFEQYNEGEEKQGPWTDIYSLGASLYLAVARKLPTDALSRGAALLNNGVDPYKPLSKLITEGYSQNFLLAIDTAMQFRAQSRPQSILEWSSMLAGTTVAPELPLSMETTTPAPVDPSGTVLMPQDYISFRHSERTSGQSNPFNTGGQPGTGGSYRTPTGPSNLHDNRDTNPPISLAIQGQSETLKPARSNVKIVSLTLFAMVAIIGAGVYIGLSFLEQDKTTPLAKTETAPVEQVNTNDKPKPNERIVKLLDQAEADILAGRLVTPQYNNAAYRYTQILIIDDKHKIAADQLEKILINQGKAIQKKLRQKRFSEAKELAASLVALVPNSPLTQKFQNEVEQAIHFTKKSTQETIESLLAKAEKHFKQHRYLRPTGRNAYAVYKEVLRQDNDNKAARKGIQNIVSYYQAAANQHIADKNFRRAEKNLKDIATIAPTSPILKGLRNKLAKAKQPDRSAKRLVSLLDKASTAYAQNRLTRPEKKNAIYYYKQALKLDADNMIAHNGIIKIENHYKAELGLAVNAKNKNLAKKLLETIRRISPNSILLKESEELVATLDVPSRPDMEIISEMIAAYVSNFETGNILELKRMSNFRPGRDSFVDQFFSQYQSYKIAVNNFRYIGKEHKGLANISITKLVNKRGDTIQPGAWSQFEIIVSQNGQGDWEVLW